MAWGWLDRKKHESVEWTGFLEEGVQFEGALQVGGTFRIDSAAKGTIVSRGTLILGQHAMVEGDITGDAVLIAGRFAGKLCASGRDEIQASAVVTGDIQTPCLLIEPGGVFDGRCLVPTAIGEAPPLSIPIRSVVLAPEASS